MLRCPTINNCYLIGTGITIVVTSAFVSLFYLGTIFVCLHLLLVAKFTFINATADGGVTWRPSYTTNDPSEEVLTWPSNLNFRSFSFIYAKSIYFLNFIDLWHLLRHCYWVLCHWRQGDRYFYLFYQRFHFTALRVGWMVPLH